MEPPILESVAFGVLPLVGFPSPPPGGLVVIIIVVVMNDNI